MAVNVCCIVNVSLCNLVKMYKDLRFCSLAAPYLNVFTSAMASAGLSALGSTWLKTTWTTVWGQPETPATDQCSPCPSASPSDPPWFMAVAHAGLRPSSAVSFTLLLSEAGGTKRLIGMGGAPPRVTSIPRFLKPEGTVVFLSPDLPDNTAHQTPPRRGDSRLNQSPSGRKKPSRDLKAPSDRQTSGCLSQGLIPLPCFTFTSLNLFLALR